MKLDIVTVAWNAGPELIDAVRSARAFGGHPIVVDNGSDQGTFEDAVTGEGVTAVRLPENRGFAAGCNAGAAAGDADLILFLNPDAEIIGGRAEDLTAAFADPAPVILGFDLVDGAGRPIPAWRPAPSGVGIVGDVLRIDAVRRAMRRPKHDADEPGTFQSDGGFVVGSAFAIRRVDWAALGGLDDRFFLWYEEVDLCQRFLAIGGRFRLCAAVTVRHHGAMSWRRIPRVRRARIRAASARRYAARHLGRGTAALVAAVTPGALFIGLCLDLRAALSRHLRRSADRT